MTAAMKVNWAKAGEWDIAVHGQRDSGGPQDGRTGGRDRGGQHTDRGGGPRQRPGQLGWSVLDSDAGGGGNGRHGWFLSMTAASCAPLTMSTNGDEGFDTRTLENIQDPRQPWWISQTALLFGKANQRGYSAPTQVLSSRLVAAAELEIADRRSSPFYILDHPVT